jgi:hypothetical protein
MKIDDKDKIGPNEGLGNQLEMATGGGGVSSILRCSGCSGASKTLSRPPTPSSRYVTPMSGSPTPKGPTLTRGSEKVAVALRRAKSL